MIALAFLLTGYLYRKLQWHPTLFFAQIINSLLGLFLGVSLIGAIGGFARSRGWIPEMNIFAPERVTIICPN
jgi:hypothetical protein